MIALLVAALVNMSQRGWIVKAELGSPLESDREAYKDVLMELAADDI